MLLDVKLARNIDDELHELALRREYDAEIDAANEQAVQDWYRALGLLWVAQARLAADPGNEPLANRIYAFYEDHLPDSE